MCEHSRPHTTVLIPAWLAAHLYTIYHHRFVPPSSAIIQLALVVPLCASRLAWRSVTMLSVLFRSAWLRLGKFLQSGCASQAPWGSAHFRLLVLDLRF